MCKQCGHSRCKDPHPHHQRNGKILRSIRPIEGGLLFDELPAQELHPTERQFMERNRPRLISQTEFDYLIEAGRQDERQYPLSLKG